MAKEAFNSKRSIFCGHLEKRTNEDASEVLCVDYITDGKNLDDLKRLCEGNEKEAPDAGSKPSILVKEDADKELNFNTKSQIPLSKIPQIKSNVPKLQAVVSPTVRTKSSPFKVPAKPPIQITSGKKTPLKSVTPLGKKMGQYDKILSPISAYIHNTPTTLLMRNAKPRTPRTTPKKFRDIKHDDSQVSYYYGVLDCPILPMLK